MLDLGLDPWPSDVTDLHRGPGSAGRQSSVSVALSKVGRRLCGVRASAGLAPAELSRMLGWHESKVARIERGAEVPSDDDVRAWGRVCGVPSSVVDDLLASVESGLSNGGLEGGAHFESLRSYPGRQFTPDAEADLLPAALELAGRLAGPIPGGRVVVTVSEVVGPLGYGIPDLVAVAVDPELLTRRAAAGVPPVLNKDDCRILAGLGPRRARSLHDTQVRTGLNEKSLQRRLAILRRRDAVVKDARGRFTRHPALVSLGRVHAVEMKVRDWRRGCQQAGTVRLWTDTATLLLGRLPAAPEELMGWTKESGVGLAVGDRLMVRPKALELLCQPAERLCASEHVWAAIEGYWASST